MSGRYRIAVGGGGTGGHAVPALAIVRAIQRRQPEVDVLYIGAPGSIEERLAKKEGYRFEAVPIAGLQRRLTLGNLLVPVKCGVALSRALGLLRRHRTQLVIGTGGFSAWPACQAARLLGTQYVLQEQNAAPGLVTKMLAGGAGRIYLGYPEAARYLKVRDGRTVHTGNPTQIDAAMFTESDYKAIASTREALGLEPARMTVFVTGGSGGARTLNQAADQIKSELLKRGYNFIWQTGKQWGNLLEATGENKGRIFVERFLERETMNRAYLAADVVVARCGAITLAELAIAGRPAVLVPYPYAAGGHQEANARAMEAAGAAVMILDRDLTADRLSNAIDEISKPPRRERMVAAMRGLAHPDAAEVIAADVLKLLEAA